MVEEILSMKTGSHVLDAFNLDYDSYTDNVVFAACIDRVGKPKRLPRALTHAIRALA